MLRPDSAALTILLGALTAIAPLTMDIYLVSMPAMTAVFATDAGRVQMTIGVYVAGWAVAQLFYGSVSDRFGRRPVIMAGLALYVVASFVCVFAWSIEALIAARFFQALGMGSCAVLTRAIVRDLYERERAAQILTYMAMVHAAAPIGAPVLGSFLHVWFGWRASFVFVMLYGLLLLGLVWRFLAETLREPDRHALKPLTLACNFATLLGSRVFIGYVLVGCLFTGGLLAWLSGSSFVLIRVFGTAEENFGFLFGTVMMGNICGLILASRLQRRRGIDGMMRLGVMIAAAGGGAMAALAWAGVNATAAVIVPMMIFMLGFSLALPQTIAGAMAPFPHIAGAASSLLGFLYSLVGVAVSMAIAGFYDGTQRPMATAIGLAGGMAVFAYAVMLRRRSAGA